MNQRTTLLSAAVLGCLAVILGASGAHALKPLLTQLGSASTFELANRYQFYHTLALLGCGTLMNTFSSKWLRYSALCLVIGTLLFSGSLYMLALYKLSVVGPVTPLGGVFLITGWVLLFMGMAKK
ncbi:MAG TPA: DUF423 domain-containing protein [Ohtaekwangia sp.]